MRTRPTLRALLHSCSLAIVATLLGAADLEAGTLVVTDANATYQNLTVGAVGDGVAVPGNEVTSGNYVVGPAGLANLWSRAIVPFPRDAFSGIGDGRPILGVRLFLTIESDFAEPGDSFSTELRLFTSPESDVRVENAHVFAAITGDGGDFTVIGELALEPGVTGSRVIEFPPDAVDAFAAAITGSDPMIGVAFREFAGSDELDEFVFGVPPRVMAIEVTADAVVPPFCDVETSAPAYRNGQLAALTRLRVANPDFVSTTARLRVEVTSPAGAAVTLLDTTGAALPGRFDRNLGPGPLFQVTRAHPRGDWSVRCSLEDPTSGDLLGTDTASFQLR